MTTKVLISLMCLCMFSPAMAQDYCVAADNGTGTVDLPADCEYVNPEGYNFQIIDGLPPGTTIEMDGILTEFICDGTSPCPAPMPPGTCELPGGDLGGEFQCFNATLYLNATGTGDLYGFNRNLAVPVTVEIHTYPRTPGDSVQEFGGKIVNMYGELFGDPDFCTFRISIGEDYGLTSWGIYALTDLGDGTFNVESFFDVNYQIEFEGCPGSQIDNYAGTTIGTSRLSQGRQTPSSFWVDGDPHKMHFPQLPDEDGWNVDATSVSLLADDWTCSETGPVNRIIFWGSWLNGEPGTIANFTVTIYANIPDPDPLDPATYSMPGDVLWSRVFDYSDVVFKHIVPDPQTWEGWYNPATGEYTYPDHDNYFQYEIRDITDPFEQQTGTIYWLGIHANVLSSQPLTLWGWKSSEFHHEDDAAYAASSCTAPDNGAGTVDLPANCSLYTVEEPFMIIDGLPPGTTIEMPGFFTDYYCDQTTPCTNTMPSGKCEGSGGTLGGNYHCFEATLDLTVTGTGDLSGFNRHLAVPVNLEIHTSPRNPGDPAQIMAAEIYRLNGELFGDPDFCTFRIYGGSYYGLPGPGQIEFYEYDPDWWVESFFDITYQIEFEGCPGSQLEDYAGITTATLRLEQGSTDWYEIFEPESTGPISNAFLAEIGPGNELLYGDGENAYGDGWYYYPMDGWWNVWFYDHPFTYERYKTIHIEFDLFPIGTPNYAEVAINWSTDQWSLDQPPGDSTPPLPGVDEHLYIGRHTVLAGEMLEGHFIFDYTIPDYNPEWVSVDIRGENFAIPAGIITHECVVQAPQSLDLAFVISQSSGECDCLPGDANGNATYNILDITYLIDYLYQSGSAPAPYPICSGDANCDCTVNILDITYLIAFLYQSGPAPCTCEEWLTACGPPLRK